jgi:hypothetical protein
MKRKLGSIQLQQVSERGIPSDEMCQNMQAAGFYTNWLLAINKPSAVNMSDIVV